jgi:uncharacterized protein YggL (DUF469 family)
MNKRIRKKKHLGEFDYRGFEITCTFVSPIDPEILMDQFIEFVELHDLGIGGGGDQNSMGFFVTKHIPGRRKPNGKRHYKHAHCDQRDQEILKEWLSRRPEILSVSIGRLIGATRGK